MAEPYLSDLKAIVAELDVPRLAGGDISCRHFFSGAAAYVGDRIFMSLSPAGLALKLPNDDRARLFDQGAQPLRYFAKAPVKKDYAVLPAHVTDDQQVLADWIRRSISYTRA